MSVEKEFVRRPNGLNERTQISDGDLGARTADVFVVGGEPTSTYVRRAKNNPELRLKFCLEHGGALISVQGPTKCGKTILCRKTLPPEKHLWLDGGSIRNEGDFWFQLVSELKVPTSEIIAERDQSRTQKELSFGFFKTLADIFQIGPSGSYKSESGKDTTTSEKYEGERRALAKKAMLASGKTLVVDDFHLIPQYAHADIIKALKAPIDQGLQCVLISIPERGFDAAEAVPDMHGRVESVAFDPWDATDLAQIALMGFSALNVTPAAAAVKRFADEAHGSPHLMQLFCRELCLLKEVHEHQIEKQSIRVPNYEAFFKQVAQRIPDRRVTQMINWRTRSERRLRNGGTADLYEIVFLSLQKLLPKRTITYGSIFKTIENLCQKSPSKHEITRIFDMLEAKAKDEIEGPAVFYHLKDRKEVLLEDPFFAFFLKWGDWFVARR